MPAKTKAPANKGRVHPKVQCPHCPEAIAAPWIQRHIERKHPTQSLTTPSAPSPTPSVQKQLRREAARRGDLVTIVTTVFPKGIPTSDPQYVNDVLDWIDTTSAMLGRRAS